MVQELTGDSAALQRAAREPQARGATALFDSVVLGLYQFRALQGRKALVVVTDGADNHSHVDYETLLRYARSAGAPIYFIAVNISVLDFGIRKELNEVATRVGRRGLPPRQRRQDRRGHQADRGGAAVAVHRGLPHRLAEARRGIPRGHGRGVEAGDHGADDQGVHPLAVRQVAPASTGRSSRRSRTCPRVPHDPRRAARGRHQRHEVPQPDQRDERLPAPPRSRRIAAALQKSASRVSRLRLEVGLELAAVVRHGDRATAAPRTRRSGSVR